MNYTKEKQAAIIASKLAAKEILKYFKKVDTLKVGKKSKHEVVTPADLAANKAIINSLSKKFPKHGFLSEETGQDRKNPEYLWVIDPLDGTTNFSIGNHFFNISIALVHKGQIVLGIIYAPFFDQLFVAEVGKGSKLNNKKIRVSDTSTAAKSMINFGYTYKNNKRNKQMAEMHANFLLKFEHAHNLGAAALEMAWVAMGRLEAYVLPHSKPWDIAAGILLIKEAGGMVTDFKGSEYKFSTNPRSTILGSNKRIHKNVLSLLKKW